MSALRARRAVEHAAEEWNANSRPPARLWGGGQLAAAVSDTGGRIHTRATPTDASPKRGHSRLLPRRRRVLVTDRVALSPKAREFLHASIRRDRHRRRRATTVLSVLVVLALAAAGVAVIQQRNAQERQRIATARGLIAQAEAARGTDPRTALQLGLAAQRIRPDDATYSSLVSTLTTTRYAGTLTGHKDDVWSVAFAPDRSTLATASLDNTVTLWNLTDPAQPRRLGSPLNGGNSVAFAPDERTLATGSDDGTVILWDLIDPTGPRRIGQPLPGTSSLGTGGFVSFYPGGNTLAAGSSEGIVILWDLTNPAQPRRLDRSLVEPNNSVFSAVFSRWAHPGHRQR